ncbi:MAG: acyl-CoA dehydrogenase family protein [Micromonosporaceae bacterium]
MSGLVDFGASKEQALFRQQVRDMLAEEPLRSAIAHVVAARRQEPDVRPLYRELGRRGLLAVNWPVEYGGEGRSLLDAAIVAEEFSRVGVPETLYVNTVQIVGLFLLMAGTAKQKATYLPPLARGELFASVLYTEPESGSDLGSLSTVAEPDGDGWRLTGVKAFSVKSDITDFGLCAARSRPDGDRYQGISLFLVDMRADGVRRHSIRSISDDQFHRVELVGVRVGADDLVGELHHGWPLLAEALAVERTGLDYSLKAERWLAAAEEVLAADTDAGSDPAVREELGRFAAATRASRLLARQVLAGLAEGKVDEALAAASKVYSSELAQQVAVWGSLRLAGLLGNPAVPAAAGAELDSAFREAPGVTISAGTSEMMLQIVANLALDDLEREARGAAADDPDAVRGRLRAAVRSRLRPAAMLAAEGEAPLDLPAGADAAAWAALRECAAPAFDAPPEAGGLGLGLAASSGVAEELGWAGLGTDYLALAFAIDATAGAADATELVSGDRPVVVAGFDTVAPAATAAPDGADGFRLVGSGGPVPAVDTVLLPVGLPGDRIGLARLDRSSGTERLTLLRQWPRDDPFPPAVVGRARVRQAAYLLGLARGSLGIAIVRATDRRQFDRPLREFQSVAFRLASALVAVEALRVAVAEAVGLADAEKPFDRPAAEVLAQGAEVAVDVVRLAMQLGGVRALTDELPMHRYYLRMRAEAGRFGPAAELWRQAGRADQLRRTSPAW